MGISTGKAITGSMRTMKKKPVILFDEPTHTYCVDGKIVPSVTQILEAEGLSDFSGIPPETLRLAQERGTAVHKATQYLDEGRLDWTTVSAQVADYLSAWQRFKNDCQPEILAIEYQVYSPTGYAGTIDRTLRMQGEHWLIDIKTGNPTRAAAIQTAAYQYADDPAAVDRRAAIQLNSDGTYKIHPYATDLMHDLNVFMAALTLYQFKRKS